MEEREAIRKYFEEHRGEMLRDIKTLVEIPSVRGEAKEGMPFGPGPRAALDKALEMAREAGLTCRDADGYMGEVDLGEGELTLGILAHLDVVPAGSGWTVTDPYTCVEKDGLLWGRGTSDDKGPVVAALYALRAVKELGIPLTKKVRLLLGTAEETGSEDLMHYRENHALPAMVFSPDGEYPVLNTEKGQLRTELRAEFAASEALPRIQKMEGGISLNAVPAESTCVLLGMRAEDVRERLGEAGTRASFEVEECESPEEGVPAVRVLCRGKNAHAANPSEGINAVTSLIRAVLGLPLADSEGRRKLAALLRLMPDGEVSGRSLGIAGEDPVSGKTTVSLDLFEMDETSFSAKLDCRFAVNDTVEKLYEQERIRAEEAGLTLLMIKNAPPHHTPEDSPLVQDLLSVYGQYTGREGFCTSTGGGTYVHRVDGGVGFGCVFPGEDTHMHGPDEFVRIDDLVISGEMFTQVILDLCR